MPNSFLHRAVAGVSLMRPRTFVDIYERIKRLSKRTEDATAQVRARIDKVERSLTTKVEEAETSVRDDVEQLNRSLTEEIRNLVMAVKDGDAERRRMNEQRARESGETSAQITSLLEQVQSQGRLIEQLTAVDRYDWRDRERIAQWRELDRDAIDRHIRRAIQEARLDQDPCPHFVAENLLPRWFYDMVIDALPPATFFDGHRRRTLTVPLPFAPTYSRLVWEYVAELVSAACGPEMVRKLRPDIDAYVRSFCPEAPLDDTGSINYKVSDGRIILRGAGYEIRPHRDPKWGFVTALMYLARPGDPVEYGTELYRVRDDREAPSENPFYVDESQCELVRKVPFRPNTALVFLNSRGAHGAAVPEDAPQDFERYLYQFRVGPDKPSIATLLNLMTDEAKALWAGGKMNKALETY